MNETFAILKAYLKTRWRMQHCEAKALADYQQQGLEHLKQRVLVKSGFYQPLLTQNFKTWPIMNKSLMLEHFDALNTVGITQAEAFEVALRAEQSRDFSPMLQNISVGLSTGTSGRRGLFIASPEERCLWAGTLLAKALARSILKPVKIGLFLRANNNLYTTIRRSNHLQLQFFDLLQDMVVHFKALNRYQPDILVAPPSVLRLLAQAREQAELNIEPTKIIAVAEVLEPLDKLYLSKAFGQTIHQIYQATEGFLAITCRLGTLHLNEEFLLVEKEWLDKGQGRFVPIITDLLRSSQPVVRYRLDDVLVLSQAPCPCGSASLALERIEGRCDDVCYFYTQVGQKLKPIFADFISRAILNAAQTIAEYQVVQHSPLQLEIGLCAANFTQAQVEVSNALQNLLQIQGCILPKLHFRSYQKPLAAEIKLRRVKRNFSLEDY